ncbi:DUF3054 domain-containing protein [Haloterrigena sp. SYSU A558-1]|uniref:DUF3054 domain-containing protein n=1 Tax=Haloterrigena gelatinilytica TaxID=2741724 RepID=A0A8J8GLR2_9EURY|nr:DUF3054 domain-containing protein [Haloterrigena gelatinilytica]NUB92348.1 DUF3054 domain-containing protein [Haloterrigena gelatinilytica]NUC71826.1 DUF3054 domain-containing protein [Haloterrigena gelatinilytica]
MDTAVRTDGRTEAVDRTTLALGVGDVGLVTGLLVYGQLSHEANPLAQPLGTLETIAPFVIGWIVVAALAGLYTRSAAAAPSRAARLTAVVWLGAANVGLLLRQGLFGDSATWPFPLVITGFGFLLLVGWRVGYATVAGRSGTA